MFLIWQSRDGETGPNEWKRKTHDVFDRFADSANAATMIHDQYGKFTEFENNPPNNTLFCLNWTLTPGVETVMELAEKVNPRMMELMGGEAYSILYRNYKPMFFKEPLNKGGARVNIINHDFVGTANSLGACFKIMSLHGVSFTGPHPY